MGATEDTLRNLQAMNLKNRGEVRWNFYWKGSEGRKKILTSGINNLMLSITTTALSLMSTLVKRRGEGGGVVITSSSDRCNTWRVVDS